jgi:Tol biopolymer transport system component
LGIDFGTSVTVAVLAGADRRIRPLLFDASPLLPSAVFAGAGLLTGVDAERSALARPGGLEPNPKRRIDEGTVWLGEREVPVVDLVAAVLDRVAGEGRRVTGGSVDEVVLTHPATWGRTRLDVLGEAARRAGLGVVGFVAEPVAAAAYFTTVLGRELALGRCLVVYDLGAGTFDIGIVRRTAAGLAVVAAAGLGDVGGLDLDAALVGHVRSLTAAAHGAWRRLDWPETPADQHSRRALWHGARAAKEQLSRHTAADVHVPLVETDLHVTREEFERVARPYLERTVEVTLDTLRAAAVPREQIAGVFLVGGSSRIPLAATLLHRALSIPPTALDHPELVVAEGSLHVRHTELAPPAPPAGHAPLASPAALARPAPTPAGAETQTPVPARPALGAGAAAPDTGGAAPRRSVKRIVLIGLLVLSLAVAGLAASRRALENRKDDGGTSAPPPQAADVVFSPDGSLLAAGIGQTAQIWDLASRRRLAVLTGHGGGTHGGAVEGVAFAPDGKTLATASQDGTVRLWNVTTGTQIGEPLPGEMSGNNTARLFDVDFSPDGKLLATAGVLGTRVWDLSTRRRIAAFGDGSWDVEFSPDGKLLAAAEHGSSTEVFYVRDLKRKAQQLGGHRNAPDTSPNVFAVAFSPDGKLLATAAGDRTVILWNITGNGFHVPPLTGHTHSIRDVDFSSDGRLLVTASEDGTIRRWNIESGKEIGQLRDASAASLGHAVAWSPNANILAATDAGSIRLWNPATSETSVML